MNCTYHIGTKLSTRETHIPFDDDLYDAKRTSLFCPIPGCPCVAVQYDGERVEKRKCYSCGGPLNDSDATPLTSTRCAKCRSKEQKKYRARRNFTKRSVMRNLGRS